MNEQLLEYMMAFGSVTLGRFCSGSAVFFELRMYLPRWVALKDVPAYVMAGVNMGKLLPGSTHWNLEANRAGMAICCRLPDGDTLATVNIARERLQLKPIKL